MERKYRLIAFVITLGIAVLFIAGIIPTNSTVDLSHAIQTFIDEQADEALSLRNWMQAKNIDALKLLNKSNKRYGNGVSIQTGKLYCYFEGEGTDELFEARTLDQARNVTAKAFDLTDWAKEYGAYAYIRHDGAFEVIISGDPFNRPGGVEGTSVYYSDLSEQELEPLGVEKGESLGGDWFLAAKKQKPVVIDTKSDLFRIIVVIAIWGVLSLIWFLLYKKQECDAEVIAKKAEYLGLKPRIWWDIHGIPRSWGKNGHAYSVTFLTDNKDRLTMYMYESEYNGMAEGAYGHLEYRRFKNHCTFRHFTVKQKPSEDI
jgi:hypothetical protein